MAVAKPKGPAEIAVAMAGIAVPVALGAWTGHLGAGMVAAIGGLAMSEAGEGDSVGDQLRDVAYAFVASVAAMLVGSWVARAGIAGAAALIAIAAAVSLVGGMSRPLARATGRFVLFMVMTSYLSARGGSAAPIELFLAGALWAAILALAVKSLRGARGPAAAPAEGTAKRKPTLRQLWKRWVGTLSTFAGWSYCGAARRVPRDRRGDPPRLARAPHVLGRAHGRDRACAGRPPRCARAPSSAPLVRRWAW